MIFFELHPENNKMRYTDYSRVDYTDFLKEQEENKIPLDEDNLSYFYKYRDELEDFIKRITELTLSQ